MYVVDQCFSFMASVFCLMVRKIFFIPKLFKKNIPRSLLMLSWFNFYVKNLKPYYICPGVRREVWIPLHFSIDGYLVVPTSYLTILVGSAVLFTHYIFIYAWVYLWTFNSVPFICLLFIGTTLFQWLITPCQYLPGLTHHHPSFPENVQTALLAYFCVWSLGSVYLNNLVSILRIW